MASFWYSKNRPKQWDDLKKLQVFLLPFHSGFFFCFSTSKSGQAKSLRKFGHLHQCQLHMKPLIFTGFVVDIALVGQVQGRKQKKEPEDFWV